MILDTLSSYLGTSQADHFAATLSYTSSLSSTSSSASSVFSDTESQSSCSTTTSSICADAPKTTALHQGGGLCPINRAATFPQYNPSACRAIVEEQVSAPAEQRRHPRRSSLLSTRPPQLVRQVDRRDNFVHSLVDLATQMVEVIWPTSEPARPCETSSRGVLPLRTFIQETLRRSRTSYSTLQVALYYLVLVKAHVPKCDFTMPQPEDATSLRALQCGRRMFLAALILASKYLQDRNYSARAWSKISGLKVCEINANEMAFLAAVNWKLHITDPIWERWQQAVLCHTPSNPPTSPGLDMAGTWKAMIPQLTPELEIIEVAPKVPVTPVRPAMPSRTSSYCSSLRSQLSDGCSSQESTPTPSHYRAPRFLEPRTELAPPTPFSARLGPLPTPLLTPQSQVSGTPAASALTFGLRRPSMCSAMAQAQNMSLARSCVDHHASIRSGLEAYHFPSRRPSLAHSTSSSASSPESMITDMSRSSRASSISSTSSVGWAPQQAKLARLATCRNARLPYPALPKCKESTPVEVLSSPDLESFHIDEAEATPTLSDTSPSKKAAMNGNGKRERSSVDLQQTVRELLQAGLPAPYLPPRNMGAPQPSMDTTGHHMLMADVLGITVDEAKGVKSLKQIVQKDHVSKRACSRRQALKTPRGRSTMTSLPSPSCLKSSQDGGVGLDRPVWNYHLPFVLSPPS